jgi:pimeloyl-ACP methyl ester carboxylesterase
MAISERLIKVDGRAAHYYEDGESHREAVILLHGGFGDAWLHWAGVMPMFAEEYRVVALDLPGYGYSDPLPTSSIGSLVDWLGQVMVKMNLEQAILIGNSFGGLIARLFAAQYPQRPGAGARQRRRDLQCAGICRS